MHRDRANCLKIYTFATFLTAITPMGKPYKKGVCEKCGTYSYVNDHHIVPRKVKRKDNKDTVRLCLNCHQNIHEHLPEEPKEEDFYPAFTQKWMLGLLAAFLLFIIFYL
jgi:5-methylcytosine-specific restriction endonuclease McrA